QDHDGLVIVLPGLGLGRALFDFRTRSNTKTANPVGRTIQRRYEISKRQVRPLSTLAPRDLMTQPIAARHLLTSAGLEENDVIPIRSCRPEAHHRLWPRPGFFNHPP